MSGFARAAASVPAGTIIQLATPAIPRGWLATNGILLPQVGQYSKLFAAIGHTHKKSTETSAALNAAGKFRLPDDSAGRMVMAARAVYDLGGVSAWAGAGVIISAITGQGVMLGARAVRDTGDSNPFNMLKTATFATQAGGKKYIAYKLTGDPQTIMAGSHGIRLQLTNGSDFFAFDTVIEKQAGGIVEKSHQVTKYVGGVATTATLTALETAPVATHAEREWVFFWDTAGNAGIYCNGVYYGSPVAFPTHVTTWDPQLQLFVQLGAAGGIECKIIESAFVEKLNIGTQLPGYSAALEVGKSWDVGLTGGASTHAHTVGGTALTIAQMPAHTHDVTGFVVNNASTSGGGANDTPTNVTGTKTTTSQGSSATHTHTLTTESSLPPYMTALFAIKY